MSVLPLKVCFCLALFSAPGICDHKRREERLVPHRNSGSSMSPDRCAAAELKGWSPLGVRNTQQRNLNKALHVRPRVSMRGAHQQEAIMAKQLKKLDELFHDTLKDIYFAEKKILATLPKMAKAAQSPDLKQAFEKHRGETEGHVARLEKVFGTIDKKPQAKTCDAIVGITDEGAEIMKEYKGSPALDAGLLAAAQAVEHYEISRYGTLRTWAQELGLDDAVRLLDQTLDEEKKTDATLTKIAEAVVNHQAEAA
jgi:ferritin-like metal-binding protein YciE